MESWIGGVMERWNNGISPLPYVFSVRLPQTRSADFQSAVSPISNRQAVRRKRRSAFGSKSGSRDARRLEAMRYSRLEICATKPALNTYPLPKERRIIV